MFPFVPPSFRRNIASGRPLLRFVATCLLAGSLAACGGVAAPGSPAPAPFEDARSQSCADTRGVEALYWDFMNGVIRADYPETVRFLPYAPGGVFIHPVQPLYSFSYPPGWQPETLIDGSSDLAGANVLRQDGLAVWRRLSFTLSGVVTARSYLDVEIAQMLAFLGITEPVVTVCFVEAGEGAVSILLRAGDFTANVNVQVFVTPFLGGFVSSIFAQLAVAPSAEYDANALGVFFPLSGQMNLGGGSSDPECSDGIDNDGDGKTDYPADPGCGSESDDSESG